MKIFLGTAGVVLVIAFVLLLTQSKNVVISQPVSINDTKSTQTYSNTFFGFTITLAPGFTVDEAYLNQTLGPGREIPGVAFRVPIELTKGTNLSTDSYLAVEKLFDVDCELSVFTENSKEDETVVAGKNTFKKATTNSAGAGNFYEDTVYVTEQGNACYAIRSVAHTTNIANYEPGTVSEYDALKLNSAFNNMVSSIIFN